MIFSSAAILSIMVAFALLGAWSGLAASAVDLLRNAYLMWDEKKHGVRNKNTPRDVVFLIVVFVALGLVAIPTYEGPLSLLSIFATAVYTFSIWQKNTKVYKGCGIPVSVLWISYNTYIGSIFGIILESVLLVVSAIGFVLELKGKKQRKKSKK